MSSDVNPARIGRPAVTHRLPFSVQHSFWTASGRIGAVGREGLYLDVTNRGRPLRLPAGDLRWSSTNPRFSVHNRSDIYIWDWQDRREIAEPISFPDTISDVAWDPTSERIAVAFDAGYLEILDPRDPSAYRLTIDNVGRGPINLLWDSEGLASGSDDGLVCTFAVDDTEIDITGGFFSDGGVNSLVGRVSGRLVTLADSYAVIVESPGTSDRTHIETVTGERVVSACLSSDKKYLITLDEYGRASTFSTADWALISISQLRCDMASKQTLIGTNPTSSRFAYIDDSSQRVLIHNMEALTDPRPNSIQVYYQNAKVVLVGDTGVGKSGLAAAIAGETFAPTPSTHARIIRSLPVQQSRTTSRASREVILWDLAGQPGYRSFHRLSLRGVSVGIVVFDSRSETAPFKGVGYWASALEEANIDNEPTRFLVSARSDRGSLSASLSRTAEIVDQYGFAQLYETSAATRAGVVELVDGMFSAIEWGTLPTIVAPQAFLEIRDFLIAKRQQGFLIGSVDELFAAYRSESGANVSTLGLFETCLERLEAAGVVLALSNHGQWLLQPELLDSYVAYLADAARSEPDGLGSISEERALRGEYNHDEATRVTDEKTMLLTAVEEVVGKQLVLRVYTDRGAELVFPSERRTDLQAEDIMSTPVLEYRFQGTLASIYAGLVVKFVNSAIFGANEYQLFHNRVVFNRGENESGFAVDYPRGDEDQFARLVVYFGDKVDRAERIRFTQYLEFQLREFATRGDVVRTRLYTHCGITTAAEVVQARAIRGFDTVLCAVCGEESELDDLAERTDNASLAAQDRQADRKQDLAQRLSVMPAREARGQFDAFLCFNSVDRPLVLGVRRRLTEQGLIVWDDSRIRGGDQNIKSIEAALTSAPTTIVCIGPSSVGAWQEEEYYAALTQVVNAKKSGRRARIIPVLLPGTSVVSLPAFLSTRTAVDMTNGITERAIQELVSAMSSSE